jgi:hypothetical protein
MISKRILNAVLYVSLIATYSCNSSTRSRTLDEPEGASSGQKLEPVFLSPKRAEIADNMTKDRVALLAMLKRVDQKAQKTFSPTQYAIVADVVGFITSRIEGKQSAALGIIAPGWPGTGKTFLPEWLKAELALEAEYYFEAAHVGLTHLPADKLVESFRARQKRVQSESANEYIKRTLGHYVTFVVIDEAQNVDARPFDADREIQAAKDRIMAELDVAFPKAESGASEDERKFALARESQRSAKYFELMKVATQEIAVRQQRFDEQKAERELAVNVVRMMTANGGMVALDSGISPLQYVENVRAALNALQNNELEKLAFGQRRKRRQLYKDFDDQKEAVVRLQERMTGVKDLPANDAERLAVEAEFKVASEKLEITRKEAESAQDFFENQLTALQDELRVNNRKKTEATAELLKIQKSAEYKSNKSEIEWMRDVEAADASESRLNDQILRLSEGIAARNSLQKRVETILKGAVETFPQFAKLAQELTPKSGYALATPHFFMYEAFSNDAEATLKKMQEIASGMTPNSRHYAGNTVLYIAFNVPALQSKLRELMKDRNDNDPDEMKRVAEMIVKDDFAKGDESELRKLVQQMIGGNPSDRESLESRLFANDVRWFLPMSREEYARFAKVIVENSIKRTISSLESEGYRVNVTYDKELLDVVRRLATNPQYGPRSAENVPEQVMRGAKQMIPTALQSHMSSIGGDRTKLAFNFHIAYDEAKNETVLRMAETSTGTALTPNVGVIQMAPAPVGAKELDRTMVIGGDTKIVPGDTAAQYTDEQRIRLRMYRQESVRHIMTVLTGSVSAGRNEAALFDSPIDMLVGNESETMDYIRKRWWPEPKVRMWEYDLYSLVARVAAVESDFIQTKGNVGIEAKSAEQEFLGGLAELLEYMEKQARAKQGLDDKSKPDMKAYLESVDPMYKTDPIFEALAETNYKDAKSLRAFGVKLREWVNVELRRVMRPGRAVNPLNAGAPRLVDHMVDEVQKGGEFKPRNIVDVYERFAKRKLTDYLNPTNAFLTMISGNKVFNPTLDTKDAGVLVSTGCPLLARQGFMKWLRDFRSYWQSKYRPE